ncbi:MAG: hypothetical protein ACK4NR_05995 [Micavibrio sp.]
MRTTCITTIVTIFVLSLFVVLTMPGTIQAAEAILPVSVRLISMEEYRQMQGQAESSNIQMASYHEDGTPTSVNNRMYDKLMVSLDNNSDHHLTLTEFSNVCRNAPSQLFKALDRDDNHLIDREEIEDYARHYNRRGCS